RARCGRGVHFQVPAVKSRLRKLRWIDRRVGLYFAQLEIFLSIQPAYRPLEGHLHAGHFTIISVVDLCRSATDEGSRIPDQPYEQAIIRVEVQSCQQAARAYSLNHLNVPTVNRRG